MVNGAACTFDQKFSFYFWWPPPACGVRPSLSSVTSCGHNQTRGNDDLPPGKLYTLRQKSPLSKGSCRQGDLFVLIYLNGPTKNGEIERDVVQTVWHLRLEGSQHQSNQRLTWTLGMTLFFLCLVVSLLVSTARTKVINDTINHKKSRHFIVPVSSLEGRPRPR